MDAQSLLEQALAERYRIDGLIGEGGMALVYRAEDLKHGRTVAIKVLRPELAAALGTQRFIREIEVAARLNHPNILGLHDSGEANGLRYFVMPFVEGESLRARLDREPTLPLEEAVRIAREVGDALEYAHEHGLVHRDIKPENILFQAGHAVVCDFGIARLTSGAGERLTGTGLAVGTFTYMSPEQLTDDADVDARSDLYALGCLIYEMLAGEDPFRASSPQASLARKLGGTVPDLLSLRADVPATVQAVVERALAVRAEDRFGTAATLTNALHTAITTAVVEKDARQRKRRHALRWAGTGIGTLLVGFLIWRVMGYIGAPAMGRIAVLPLTNEVNDTSQAFYVQGLHQDLVLEMSRAGLRVINPTSVARYSGTERPLREIAAELDVDGIIQGRASIGPDRLGLQLSLIAGLTEEILWTESFEAIRRNVTSLYRNATRAIAEQIGFELDDRTLARLASSPETDPQVYEALLQARFHWQKLTEEGIAVAQDYYELALERDSLSAEAWVGLAAVWQFRAQMGFGISGAEADSMGRPAMARAEAIDPTLSTVQAQLALHRTWVGWDWPAGEDAFLRALEADPTDSQTRAYYSHLLLYQNRDDEALAQVERAAQLDPFNTLIQALYAMDLNFLRLYDEAEAVLLRVRERDPDHPMVLSTLRNTYHLLGREDDAMTLWDASYAAAGDTVARQALARGFETGAYPAALGAVADLFVERSTTSYVTPWQIATLNARAGNFAVAVEYLEAAFEDHDQNMPYITIDPIFDALHDEPRFLSLVERLGLSL